jgi:GH25 family lysozyme M1 (1,4-beta-N-acetylmuramidase)
MQTSVCKSQGGTSVSGACTGPSDLQCCIGGNDNDDGGSGSAEYGVDISTTQSTSTMSCFKSNGFGSYIIPRGYKSSGYVDSNVCTNLNNAKSAGIPVRDVYMFPCPTCSKSASSQVNELVSYLKSNCNSGWSGRVWLDIEGSQYWLGSSTSNKSWYESLVDSCKSSGARCGVYSNKSQWQEIFGSSSYSYGSSLPLWYAHYDNNPSFSDFSTFGGWRSPHAKQYKGDTTLCSAGVDKNYATDF